MAGSAGSEHTPAKDKFRLAGSYFVQTIKAAIAVKTINLSPGVGSADVRARAGGTYSART